MNQTISKKTIKKLTNRATTSEEFVDGLWKRGIRVGWGTRFFSPDATTVDTQNPHMLEIGDNVRITKGCTILTHDYSWSVLAGVYGECLGGVGSVIIGNNVFIGMYTIILKGTTIGDNVIIGAESVVSGTVESNSVYAGVPARKIMTLEEYYQKKRNNYEQEARQCYTLYKKSTGTEPDESVLKGYFWLFCDRNGSIDIEYDSLMKRTGYYGKCRETFEQSKPKYDGFSTLVKSFNEGE